MAKKIVAITGTKDNIENLSEALAAADVDFATAAASLDVPGACLNVTWPDVKSELAVWAEKGFKCAVIFAGSFAENDTIVDDVIAYVLDPNNIPIRPVIVFGADASPMDSAYSKLVEAGVYNFVIPTEEEDSGREYMDTVASLVKKPRTLAQVLTYKKASSQMPVAQAVPTVTKVITEVKQEKVFITSDRKVVAVTTTRRRGGSTVLAALIARSLVVAKQQVAMLTDKATALSLWSLMIENDDASEDNMPEVFKYHGIYVYPEFSVAKVANGINYIIADLGTVSTDKARNAEELDLQRTKMAILGTADARFVNVPMGVPSDMRIARDYFTSDRGRFDNWVVGFWGILDEELASCKMLVKAFSPRAIVCKIPEIIRPFAKNEPNMEIMKLLNETGALPKTILNRLMAKEEEPEAEETVEAASAEVEPKRKGFFGWRKKDNE